MNRLVSQRPQGTVGTPFGERRSERVRRALTALGIGLALAIVPFRCWTAECTLSTTGVNFGIYDPFRAQPTDSAGTMEVACDVAVPYSIALSPGSGSYTARSMSSGAHELTYNLYTDAQRIIVWGDGSGTTATVSGNGVSAEHTVYARIEAGQNVHVGTYGDTVVVTLTF